MPISAKSLNLASNAFQISDIKFQNLLETYTVYISEISFFYLRILEKGINSSIAITFGGPDVDCGQQVANLRILVNHVNIHNIENAKPV